MLTNALHKVRAALVLCLLFCALVIPTIFIKIHSTPGAHGQYHHHLPAIKQFAAQWPNFDLIHYSSATTPGYHLALAFVHRFVSDNMIILQLVSAGFGLALLLVLSYFAARYIDAWTTLAMITPLLFSNYLLGCSIWLNTENAAFALVFLCLGLAAMSSPTGASVILNGILAAPAVFVRQINIFLLAPIVVGGLWQKCEDGKSRLVFTFRSILPVVVSIAIPAILLIYFILLWGGLSPDNVYRARHSAGANPAFITLTLALFGAFGLFYAGAFIDQVKRLKISDRSAWIISLICLSTSVLWPTTHAHLVGRYGGVIWEIVKRAPCVFERSLVFPVLTVLGGLVLLLLWRACRANNMSREAGILYIGFFSWLITQTVNSMAYQRYAEYVVVPLLLWLSALALANRPTRNLWMIRIGPIILGILQLALTIFQIYMRVFLREFML